MIPYFPPHLTIRDPNDPPPSPWLFWLMVLGVLLLAVVLSL